MDPVPNPRLRYHAPMDLDELRALLAVADTGSMLSASERLGLPRTTLRRRIESLEARVGSPLFFRGAQGVMLSPAGLAIAVGGRRILDQANVLLTSARQLGGDAAGILQVVLPIGLAPHAMLPIFRACRERHPRLRFEIQFHEDPLAALGADVVFHFGDRVTSGMWVTRTILQLPEVLVATDEYLARAGTPATVEEVVAHEVYSWKRPGADPARLPTLDGGHVAIEPVLASSDVHTLRQLALAGAGMAFVPDAGLPDPGVEAATLVPVLSHRIGRTCPLNVVVPEPLARSPQVRALQQSILGFLG